MAKVLVCEDDEDLRALVGHALAGAGHDVAPSAGVAEALACLDAERFDVVVTDLGLPDGSGLTVCEAGAAAGSRVVVVTANPKLADVPDVARCAERVLAKPFRVSELVAVVGPNGSH
jgi:DNA-binding response OmpR family regulator